MSFSGVGIAHLVSAHGYSAVASIVGVEGMGIPVPGETTLIAAAIYAGTSHQLRIALVIAAAAAGAMLGDNVGYWIGRRVGCPLLSKYGHHARVTPERLRLGEYLFRCHGGKFVIIGRFIAVLRSFTALLAGANRMRWRRFVLFDAIGATLWASLWGAAAYALGERLHHIAGPAGILMLVFLGVAVGAGVRFLRRHEAILQARADASLGHR
jgi:membrane protein DedA with SNARE-associated domain